MILVVNASPYHSGAGHAARGGRARARAAADRLRQSRRRPGRAGVRRRIVRRRRATETSSQQLPASTKRWRSSTFDAARRSRCAERSTRALERTFTRRCVMGVRDYVGKNGFPGVLLGLSGGIDSALTLAVAVDALGAERVRAVMMPSPYTAPISLDDAREMAGDRRRPLRRDPDRADVRAFLDALAPEFEGLPPETTEENLQARIRGTLLMALSNKFGSIVLTTGNKSEMAVGYATLYGDMAGGFAVLKDIGKTLVYRLCALSQQPRPRHPGADHHAPAVGGTAPRPDRPGQPAAVRRAGRDHRSLRRAGPQPGRNRGDGLRGGPVQPGGAARSRSASTSAARPPWAFASRRADSARTGVIRSLRRGTSGTTLRGREVRLGDCGASCKLQLPRECTITPRRLA